MCRGDVRSTGARHALAKGAHLVKRTLHCCWRLYTPACMARSAPSARAVWEECPRWVGVHDSCTISKHSRQTLRDLRSGRVTCDHSHSGMMTRLRDKDCCAPSGDGRRRACSCFLTKTARCVSLKTARTPALIQFQQALQDAHTLVRQCAAPTAPALASLLPCKA